MRLLLLVLALLPLPSYATSYSANLDGLYIILLPTKCKVGNGQLALLWFKNNKQQACYHYKEQYFHIKFDNEVFSYPKTYFKLHKST